MSYINTLRTASRRLYSTSTTAEKRQSQHHHTITLRDGRTLGFGEYGDLNGKPLVYLHGFPSSRLEAREIDPLAIKHGIRLIAPDRPGFGLSTLRPPGVVDFPPRQLMDYPSDLSELTTHLKLDRFSLIGGSGGGPFALACASQLPPTTLHRVGLLASAGPWRIAPTADGNDMSSQLTKNVMWSSYLLYLASTYAPTLSIGTANLVVRALGSRWIEFGLEKWLETMLLEREVLKDPASKGKPLPKEVKDAIPEMRGNLVEVFMEGFAQGSEGAVKDVHLFTQSWGIPVGDIKREVRIWHGAKDANSPVNAIRYLASQLPNGKYVEYPEFDHFQLGTKIEEILLEMVEGLDPTNEKRS